MMSRFIYRRKYVENLKERCNELQRQNCELLDTIKKMKISSERKDEAMKEKEMALIGLEKRYKDSIADIDKLREKLKELICEARKKTKAADKEMKTQIDRIRKQG